jgi:hypothetical protein
VSEERKPEPREDTRERKDAPDQGIRKDERGQEQPADKQRAQENK